MEATKDLHLSKQFYSYETETSLISLRRTGDVFFSLIAKNCVRMPTSPGHFLCLHLLFSLLVTFFLSDQPLFGAGNTLLASPGLNSVEEKSRNPSAGI